MLYVYKIYENYCTIKEYWINYHVGDSLVFAFTILFGWATINSVELQDKNSAFPTGSLSLHEVSLVISYIYIGCLTGNFAVIPCVQSFGPKRTIHLCSIPLIVFSNKKLFIPKLKDIIKRKMCSISVGRHVDDLRSKYLLFVRIESVNRFGSRRHAVCSFYTNKWDLF